MANITADTQEQVESAGTGLVANARHGREPPRRSTRTAAWHRSGATRNVWKALSIAIDREAYVNAVHPGEIPTANALPTDSPGFLPELDEEYAYDPDAAKELLAEAGYPDGFSFDFTINQGSQRDLEALQPYWAAIGVTVNLKNAASTEELFAVVQTEPMGGPDPAHVDQPGRQRVRRAVRLRELPRGRERPRSRVRPARMRRGAGDEAAQEAALPTSTARSSTTAGSSRCTTSSRRGRTTRRRSPSRPSRVRSRSRSSRRSSPRPNLMPVPAGSTAGTGIAGSDDALLRTQAGRLGDPDAADRVVDRLRARAPLRLDAGRRRPRPVGHARAGRRVQRIDRLVRPLDPAVLRVGRAGAAGQPRRLADRRSPDRPRHRQAPPGDGRARPVRHAAERHRRHRARRHRRRPRRCRRPLHHGALRRPALAPRLLGRRPARLRLRRAAAIAARHRLRAVRGQPRGMGQDRSCCPC